jgi:hypothetical protein
MKLISHTSKWKRHSSATSRKHLRRIRRKRGIQAKPIYPKVFQTIIVPVVFSIMKNPDNLLRFYKEIEKISKNGTGINFDMSNVKIITLDAILYTLSLFNYLKAKGVYYFVQGNNPIDEECNKLFQSSGFYKFITFGIQTKINENIFSIESGDKVDPNLAKKIIDFSRNKLHMEPNKPMNGVYISLIESMGNTKQHAYLDNNILPRWWVAAFYDDTKKVINYVFLDNGQGIPTTIRKNFPEKIKRFAKIKNIDSMLIKSALEGEFRTRTNLENRGKGLPQIYGFITENQIFDLQIISNRGIINTNELYNKINLIDTFRGTLLSWNYHIE